MQWNIQWMPEYQTGLVFRQLALVAFPDSSDFRMLSEIQTKNPKPNTFYSYKSIQTGCLQLKWPKRCLKFEFSSVRISAFRSFGIQTFAVLSKNLILSFDCVLAAILLYQMCSLNVWNNFFLIQIQFHRKNNYGCTIME